MEEVWRKIRRKLPDKFERKIIPAVRESKKGRAKEGIISAVSKEIERVEMREIRKGAMEIKFKRS